MSSCIFTKNLNIDLANCDQNYCKYMKWEESDIVHIITKK